MNGRWDKGVHHTWDWRATTTGARQLRLRSFQALTSSSYWVIKQTWHSGWQNGEFMVRDELDRKQCYPLFKEPPMSDRGWTLEEELRVFSFRKKYMDFSAHKCVTEEKHSSSRNILHSLIKIIPDLVLVLLLQLFSNCFPRNADLFRVVHQRFRSEQIHHVRAAAQKSFSTTAKIPAVQSRWWTPGISPKAGSPKHQCSILSLHVHRDATP